MTVIVYVLVPLGLWRMQARTPGELRVVDMFLRPVLVLRP